jgi:hypothetical protein
MKGMALRGQSINVTLLSEQLSGFPIICDEWPNPHLLVWMKPLLSSVG